LEGLEVLGLVLLLLHVPLYLLFLLIRLFQDVSEGRVDVGRVLDLGEVQLLGTVGAFFRVPSLANLASKHSFLRLLVHVEATVLLPPDLA